MGQLAKQMAERPTETFGAKTKKNPKEECKAVVTRRQKKENKKKIRVVMRSQPLRLRPRVS